jgi:SAM-dependent methyltransferase
MSADGFDRTYLRANREGYRVHRDYAAHFFRWGWAVSRKEIGFAGQRVLDVGCGPDVPLLRVASYKSALPGYYVGVDLNRKLRELTASEELRVKLFPQTDFTNAEQRNHIWCETGNMQFDTSVCFEVIEHMPPESAVQLLLGLWSFTKPTGRLLLSTPVSNGKPANNHVHEYTIDELQALLASCHWQVRERYGTFMSYQEVHPAISEWCAQFDCDPVTVSTLYEQLREYYGDDVMSTFLAPIAPNRARNNLWVCWPRARS